MDQLIPNAAYFHEGSNRLSKLLGGLNPFVHECPEVIAKRTEELICISSVPVKPIMITAGDRFRADGLN